MDLLKQVQRSARAFGAAVCVLGLVIGISRFVEARQPKVKTPTQALGQLGNSPLRITKVSDLRYDGKTFVFKVSVNRSTLAPVSDSITLFRTSEHGTVRSQIPIGEKGNKAATGVLPTREGADPAFKAPLQAGIYLLSFSYGSSVKARYNYWFQVVSDGSKYRVRGINTPVVDTFVLTIDETLSDSSAHSLAAKPPRPKPTHKPGLNHDDDNGPTIDRLAKINEFVVLVYLDYDLDDTHLSRLKVTLYHRDNRDSKALHSAGTDIPGHALVQFGTKTRLPRSGLFFLTKDLQATGHPLDPGSYAIGVVRADAGSDEHEHFANFEVL